MEKGSRKLAWGPPPLGHVQKDGTCAMALARPLDLPGAVCQVEVSLPSGFLNFSTGVCNVF